MSRNEQEAEINYDISSNIATNKLLTYIICFSFFLSCLHQYTFWSVFKINIFNYLTIQDILVRSIIPTLAVSGCLIGILYGQASNKNSTKNSKSEKVKIIFHATILSVLPIALGIALIIAFNEYLGIMLITLGITSAIIVLLSFSKTIKYLTEKTRTHETVIITILMMSFASIGMGLAQAYEIKKGTSTISLTAESKFINPKENLRFIGEAGGLVFFWNKESNTLTQIERSNIDVIRAHQK